MLQSSFSQAFFFFFFFFFLLFFFSVFLFFNASFWLRQLCRRLRLPETGINYVWHYVCLKQATLRTNQYHSLWNRSLSITPTVVLHGGVRSMYTALCSLFFSQDCKHFTSSKLVSPLSRHYVAFVKHKIPDSLTVFQNYFSKITKREILPDSFVLRKTTTNKNITQLWDCLEPPPFTHMYFYTELGCLTPTNR